jgi:hypothetical protein
VSAFAVVVVDVFLDCVIGLFQRVVGGHFQFGLDSPEARFHEGVVVTVGGVAHALAHLATLDQLSIAGCGILTAAITVVY